MDEDKLIVFEPKKKSNGRPPKYTGAEGSLGPGFDAPLRKSFKLKFNDAQWDAYQWRKELEGYADLASWIREVLNWYIKGQIKFNQLRLSDKQIVHLQTAIIAQKDPHEIARSMKIPYEAVLFYKKYNSQLRGKR